MRSTPLLEDHHRDLYDRARAFALEHLRPRGEPAPQRVLDEARAVTRLLGDHGWLAHAVPAPWGAAPPRLDVRALVVLREALAYESGLADTQLAVQGLGSYPLATAGDDALRARLLPEVAAGRELPAFALTEPEAGSDVASLRCAASPDGPGYVLHGVKRFISNAGAAFGYSLFARVGDPALGHRGIAAFWVPADAPGLTVVPQEPTAPHPLGELRLDGVRVPASHRLGAEGEGFRLAMGTLDRFRTTVGGAALGLAARALDESLARAATRHQFGAPLLRHQGVAFPIADTAVELEAARGLVYRAGLEADRGAGRVTLAAAQAKLFATEAAQRAVDRAVQVWGGEGVMRGSTVERLYREVRALRIYEGASEVLKGVIAARLAADVERG